MEKKSTNKALGKRIDRRGFTLIELLVVIAIISLLVSILLPTLQEAKVYAKRVTCAANMKNIGLASSLYGTEFEGIFPSVNGNTPNYDNSYIGGNVWSMCIYTWTSGGQDDVWMGAYPEIGAIKTEDRVLAQYAEDYKVWKCPADDNRNDFWTSKGAPKPGYYDVYGSSYGFNANALHKNGPLGDWITDFNSRPGLWGKNRENVARPGLTVEYYEFAFTTTDVGLRAHDMDEWNCNFLFADGHVGYHLVWADSSVFYGGETGFTFDSNF